MQPIKSIQFPNEPTVYIAPTWAELHALAATMARQIKQSGQSFDQIITLASGGWPMAVVMADLLKLRHLASIGVRFYTGINERLPEPEVYHPLQAKVKDQRILLFDDVSDTGESLAFVKDHLLADGAQSVQTATLLFKPHSRLKPDYYGAETSAWIIFPHEVVESVEILGEKWLSAGLSLTEMMTRFNQFGFPSEWVEECFPAQSAR